MTAVSLSMSEVIDVELGGNVFEASRWARAHLRMTVERLKREHPGARLVVIQGSYHEGVPQSAGTHDKDWVYDVEIEGLSWWVAQRFLRECGWAVWFRHTGTWASEGAWHIHMVGIPLNLPDSPSVAQIQAAYAHMGIEVGTYVPGQVYDYYRHTFGLRGQHTSGADHSWFPPNINATVYKEDAVPYLDWPEEDRKKLVADVRDGLLNATVASNVAVTGKRKVSGMLTSIEREAAK